MAIPARQTVIFVDWDDTLFPTTHLSEKGVLRCADTEVPQEVVEELKSLASKVARVLQALAGAGQVVIVTASQGGWVARTAKHFLGLKNLPPVISAREAYGHMGSHPVQWKEAAFAAALMCHRAMAPTGIVHAVSLGDSEIEREALKRACCYMPWTQGTTVKFPETPTLEQLTTHVEAVTQRVRCMSVDAGTHKTVEELAKIDIDGYRGVRRGRRRGHKNRPVTA
mmetsp:Transcript_5887/g.14312  ORF Transcript_5887/g.14312 Transcript_5887/m.14312 type:complete len:225 (+) Transcript_5887:34-708(+)